MNFELSDEQGLLREAAAQALARRDTIAAARAAADGGEPLDLWATSREAGWSGLLVAEDFGGAGLGLFDAMLVLEQCGRRLASAGLLGHLPATLVLQRAGDAGDEIAAGALGAVATGARRAAIVHACPPDPADPAAASWLVDASGGTGRRAPLPVASGNEGGTARITGAAGFQPDVVAADLLVVPAAGRDGAVAAYLVEPGADGLTIEAASCFDRSRPLGHVDLEGTPGVALSAGEGAIAEAWNLAQTLLAADALGVSDAVRELAVSYAKDRHAFGRPIGSYQAIKHQLVEMLRASATARSLSYYAAIAAESRPTELGRAAACVRFAAERAAGFATRTCIAVHGGIGNTWEHDAPFFWRRAQLSRLLLGGEAAAGERVAAEVIAAARRRAGDSAPA